MSEEQGGDGNAPQDSTESTPSGQGGETLRDRKARLTREAIHTAAVRLAYTKGLEEATIAQISAEAGISQRTFFNYFASKEDAIIGTAVNGPDPRVVDEAVAAADFSRDVFSETAAVIREIMSHSLGDDETREMRRVLFMQNPLLVQRKSDTSSRLASLLIDVLADRLADRIAALDLPAGFSTRDAARMIVLISFAPLRNTYAMVAEQNRLAQAHEQGPDAPRETLPPPDTTPEASFERFTHSLHLFRSILEGLRS